MKITCTRERLIQGITIAERVSGKNLTLPVLNCVLLEVVGGRLCVRATNLELGVEVVIPAELSGEGKIAVSGSVLVGVLGSLSHNGPVTLVAEGGNIVLQSPQGISTIKGQPADDFPVIPQLSEAKSFTLPKDHLIRGIRNVVYSASTSSIKPEQTSIYIYADDGCIVFAATDSFRLAEKRVEVKGEVPNFEPLLVPARNAVDLLRVLEAVPEEHAEVRLLSNQIALRLGNVYVTSRLTDGTFPDYRQVIPKQTVAEAVLLKQDVIQVLKKLSIFADKSSQVSVHVKPASGVCSFESRSADVGESEDVLRGTVTGEPLDINFNYRYLLDCFQSLPVDSVKFSFGGVGRPLVIRGVSDPSFLYLVMPMNK